MPVLSLCAVSTEIILLQAEGTNSRKATRRLNDAYAEHGNYKMAGDSITLLQFSVICEL